MANTFYTRGLHRLAGGNLDLDTPPDLRAALVMSNTTADTEEDKTLMNAFTTLDECDGSNYSRTALTGDTLTESAANDRSEYDVDDIVFTTLGNGTRQIVGLLIYLHVTNDTDSVPIAYIPLTAFDPGGATVTFQIPSTGIFHIKNP